MFQLSTFGFYILIVGKGWFMLYWLISLFYHHILNDCFLYRVSTRLTGWFLLYAVSTVFRPYNATSPYLKYFLKAVNVKFKWKFPWEFYGKLTRVFLMEISFQDGFIWISHKNEMNPWQIQELGRLLSNILFIYTYTAILYRVRGSDIQPTCGECIVIAKDQCHHINGSCLGGCDRGYQGIKCAEGCTYPLTS